MTRVAPGGAVAGSIGAAAGAAAVGVAGAVATAVAATVRPTIATAPSERARRGRCRTLGARAATRATTPSTAPIRTAHTHPGVGAGAATVIGIRATVAPSATAISQAPTPSAVRTTSCGCPTGAAGTSDRRRRRVPARADGRERDVARGRLAAREHHHRHAPTALGRRGDREGERACAEGELDALDADRGGLVGRRPTRVASSAGAREEAGRAGSAQRGHRHTVGGGSGPARSLSSIPHQAVRWCCQRLAVRRLGEAPEVLRAPLKVGIHALIRRW